MRRGNTKMGVLLTRSLVLDERSTESKNSELQPDHRAGGLLKQNMRPLARVHQTAPLGLEKRKPGKSIQAPPVFDCVFPLSFARSRVATNDQTVAKLWRLGPKEQQNEPYC
jgi:hypothetical protein